MKKIILMLLAAAAMAPAAEAQIVRSTTFSIKKERKTVWYVRAGVSLNNLTGSAMSEFKKQTKNVETEDGASFGFGTRAGYDFEVGFQKYFGKTDLYWGMQLGLGTRGGSFSTKWNENYTQYNYASQQYEIVGTDEYEAKTYLNTFGVKYTPFQIGYKYPVGDKLKIDGHLGLFLSVDFAGKLKEEASLNGETADQDYDFSDYDEMYRFDAGLQLGIGVWYGRFNLDFTWQRGFAPYVDNFPFKADLDGKRYNSSNAILSLGVSF